MKTLRKLLKDNRGDENVSKLIWVCIVFTVGAILLLLITTAFQGQISNWYKAVIDSWFNEGTGMNGKYVAAASTTTAP